MSPPRPTRTTCAGCWGRRATQRISGSASPAATAAAAQGDRLEKRLYTAIAAETGGAVSVTDEPGAHGADAVLAATAESGIDALVLNAGIAVGGRIVVMSYQSLEDRLVKRMFQLRSSSDAPRGLPVTPDQLRWNPLPIDKTPKDFVDGLYTMAGNGSAESQHGVGIHLYAANRAMEGRFFYDADAELLIVPQQGRLSIATEFGVLDVEPQEIALIPREFGPACIPITRHSTHDSGEHGM